MRKLLETLEKEDMHILDRVKDFANGIVHTSPEMAPVAKSLLQIAQRVVCSTVVLKLHDLTFHFNSQVEVLMVSKRCIQLLQTSPRPLYCLRSLVNLNCSILMYWNSRASLLSWRANYFSKLNKASVLLDRRILCLPDLTILRVLSL